eukprot:244970-Amphidinium_carterae.1
MHKLVRPAKETGLRPEFLRPHTMMSLASKPVPSSGVVLLSYSYFATACSATRCCGVGATFWKPSKI